MINTVNTVYYYPNNMGRIILLSMEEILGRNGLNAVLNMADLSDMINNYPPNNLQNRLCILKPDIPNQFRIKAKKKKSSLFQRLISFPHPLQNGGFSHNVKLNS